ncbi:MAG: ribonuclease R [Cardiobacteriaceae bacterium]|nr:ribonuclease R [Cardiobacteriaceae bacterium]
MANKKATNKTTAKTAKSGAFAANWQTLDPHFEREKRKYGDNPLPSREYILAWLAEQGELMTFRQMVKAFALEGDRADFLEHRLKAMLGAGQILRNRQGRFGIARKMDLLSGQVVAHPEGYGFFSPDSDEADGFIAPKYMQELMHGDRILARVKFVGADGRKEYAPVEILERGQKRVVGKISQRHGIWSVVPENRRLTQPVIIPGDQRGGAKSGQIVLLEITEYPGRHQQAIGRVISVLGEAMAAGMEVTVAIANHNIPHEFSAETEKQVAKLPDALRPEDYEGRIDLRHLPFVTIDGINSRDFDDAVFAEKRGENYRLYVAIADVSHYVPADSPLDHDAYERGTSVYFPDRVIPMLPEKLSTGLCSLNPQVDRLALVCEMTIAVDGSIRRSKFHQAVIHSHCRFTYDTVEEILFDRDEAVREGFKSLLGPLEALKAVYDILLAARHARHTIEFDMSEAEFFYDSEGKIESIEERKRLNSHKLIEECMIAANVCAAKFLHKQKLPGLYRVHDEPSEERLEKFIDFAGKLGLVWRGQAGSVEPRHFKELLDAARERNEHHLIEKMMLRSMAQAVYSPENRGHFGLALESYAHFTSPIRRYPDLLLHRAVTHHLQGGSRKNYVYSPESMVEKGKHCSMAERRADDATRDAMDFLKCEFMSHRLGEVFSGRISGVTSFGFFVTLDDFFIDGLVHISTLTNDYYHFDADHLTLTGERGGQRFAMLDAVEVRVAKVDIDDKKIDFELIRHSGMPQAKSRSKRTTTKAAPARKPAAKAKAPAKKPAGKSASRKRSKA